MKRVEQRRGEESKEKDPILKDEKRREDRGRLPGINCVFLRLYQKFQGSGKNL